MTDVQEQFLAATYEANEDANKGQINTAEVRSWTSAGLRDEGW
ncbi:hypothetical protein AB4Z01_01775 [Inquilinus sp. YAF38]